MAGNTSLKSTVKLESLRTNLEETSCLAVKISGNDDVPVCLLRYDKTEEKWLKYADLDLNGVYMFEVIVNDENLIFTGGIRNEIKIRRVKSWNLRTKKWKQLPALTYPRSFHTMCNSGGKIYVIGGMRGETVLKSVEVFSSTGEWRKVRDMRKPRMWAAAVTLNGNIYVMGGRSGRDGKSRTHSVERYDPTTDIWTCCAFMINWYSEHSAAVHNGFIYVVGLDGAERYDPQRDEWTMICSLPTKIENPACISLNNQLWAIGGWLNDDPKDYAYVYDEASDRWMEKTRLPEPGVFSCFPLPEVKKEIE